jgi:hypothetical protein
LTITLPNNIYGPIDIQLIDIHGRICQNDHFEAIGGTVNSFKIGTSNLISSVYTVVIICNDAIFNNQLIVTP